MEKEIELGKDIRVAGRSIIGEKETTYLEAMKDTDDFDEMDCKYCYKCIRQKLSGINMLACPECGAGLTPDFFKYENLKRWMEGNYKDLETLMDEDENTKEAKEWWGKKE